jgi:Tfp pilus assembly protein PilF
MERWTVFVLLVAAALTSAGCARSPETRKQQALERGKQRLASKDFARAVLEFKNAAQAAPRDADVHYQLGLAYIGTQDIPSAVASFRTATEINPGHSDAQIKLAEIFSGSRNTDLLKDAARRMETVLSTSPKNPDALQTLAYAEFGLGELQDGESHLAEAVDTAPGNLKAAIGLAQLRISQKKLVEAEQILRRVSDQKPITATPFIVLAGFYTGLKRPSDARRELLRALDIDRDNPIALLYLGSMQLKSGEMDDADKTYKRLAGLQDKQYKAIYGTFLFHTGKRDRAIQEFERLAAADPADRTMRSRPVSAYLMAGRKSDAERILTAALKKNRKDTDALLQRSRMLMADGNYSEADASLNQVVSFEPNSAQAHYLLARVHEHRGNVQSRRQELTEALRLKKEMLVARIELSGLLIGSKAAKSALELMNQTPEWQKQNLEVRAHRNWALYALGDRDEMRKDVAEGLVAARTPDFLLQDALLKLDRRELAGARASLHEVLERTPEETRALDILAYTYMMEKQPALATRKIREHVAAHPKSARLQHYLGSALQRSGSTAEARAAFIAAKAADSTFWLADISLASLDLTENHPDRAREVLLPLLSHPLAGSQAQLLLAFAEGKSGNGAAAVNHYRKVVESQPDNVFALNNLAVALVDNGNAHDEALKVAQRAKELAPDNATVDDTLGWVFYKKGLYTNAVQYLESSVKRQSNAIRHAHLALAYAKRGDTVRGLEQLQAAIKLNPTLPEVVAAQKVLLGNN